MILAIYQIFDLGQSFYKKNVYFSMFALYQVKNFFIDMYHGTNLFFKCIGMLTNQIDA